MYTFMLDTNIVIYVIKERPISALKKFNQYNARVCVSMITVAEMYFGAENSQFVAKNIAQVEDFLSRVAILDYDVAAAREYGKIFAQLTKQGNVISENDMHIAGHARSLGLVLVTNNVGEFERIDGLNIENWAI